MKTKILGGILIILLISGLANVYFNVRRQDALLVISGSTLRANQVDQMSDSLMLTYKNRTRANITALNTRQDVNLIETNHKLPFVMNYSILHGGFFRQDAVQYRHAVAVLNEYAAFKIFGTIESTGNVFTMNSITYVVVGVIDDKDMDNLNVYIPIGLLGDAIESISINLDISPYTAEEIVNKLQQVGIIDDDYRFINFAAAYVAVTDSIIIVLKGFIISGLYFVAKKSWNCAKKEILILRNLYCEMYAVELIKKPPIWRLIGLITTVICIATIITILSVDVIHRILIVYDVFDMVMSFL